MKTRLDLEAELIAAYDGATEYIRRQLFVESVQRLHTADVVHLNEEVQS